MQISFDKIPVETVPHMRGGEKEVFLQKFIHGPMKVLRGVLPPGATIGPHVHETNSEVIYILSGTGKVLFRDTWEPLAPGACHYCHKGESHSLVNDSGEALTFFAVVPEQ